jgi:predicted RNase H-like nuclease (RuvC/YqgF family)
MSSFIKWLLGREPQSCDKDGEMRQLQQKMESSKRVNERVSENTRRATERLDHSNSQLNRNLEALAERLRELRNKTQ